MGRHKKKHSAPKERQYIKGGVGGHIKVKSDDLRPNVPYYTVKLAEKTVKISVIARAKFERGQYVAERITITVFESQLETEMKRYQAQGKHPTVLK